MEATFQHDRIDRPAPRVPCQPLDVHILNRLFKFGLHQGGITCGAIEDPRKSSKAIDERVIINFRDKNVVIARFRDKNVYR